MTNQELQRRIKEAAKEVKSWPLWKQNILVHSGCPKLPTPRKPVINK